MLSKRQEEGLIIKWLTREYRIEASHADFRKLPVVDQVIKASNVVDFDRIKKKDNILSCIGRNEIFLQCNMFTGDADAESIRHVVISRYRQAQENSIYLKNKPAIEIII
jgi:hypothetical protein